jgi:hypothetical protein
MKFQNVVLVDLIILGPGCEVRQVSEMDFFPSPVSGTRRDKEQRSGGVQIEDKLNVGLIRLYRQSSTN